MIPFQEYYRHHGVKLANCCALLTPEIEVEQEPQHGPCLFILDLATKVALLGPKGPGRALAAELMECPKSQAGD